jgi:hypothetical protein
MVRYYISSVTIEFIRILEMGFKRTALSEQLDARF